MEQAREKKLQIHKSNQGNIIFLRFVGVIDESFEGAGLGKGLEGPLVVSLGAVTRITSFGIRQWMEFISNAGQKCSPIYFVECAPRIVDQFNMVAGFAGKGIVISFQAPFRCDVCGAEPLRLFQVDESAALIREGRLESGPCPKDNSPQYFDDDPAVYLSYVASQPPFEVDPRVASFLAGRVGYSVPESLRKVRIEKRIRDRYTFISVIGDVAEDFPLQKIAEGLEGDVVFDLTAVRQISEMGLSNWRQLVRTVAPSTEKILVVGLPSSMLEKFSGDYDLANKGQALSLHLPYSCGSCSITTQLEVEVGKNYKSLSSGAPPELTCPDCGQPAHCVASAEMLPGLTELPAPAADLDAGRVIAWARKPIEPPIPLPNKPPRHSTTASLRTWLALAGIGLLGLSVVAFGAYLMAHRDGGEGASERRKVKEVLLEASHPQAPPWREQSFSIKGSDVFISGNSGYVATKEEGFKTARAAALETLCHQLAGSIRDPLWIEHVGGQFQSFRAAAVAELEKALLSGDADIIQGSRRRVNEGQARVSHAMIEGGAPQIRPGNTQYYWEQVNTDAGKRYRVWALVEMPKPDLQALAEHYTRRGEALSAVAVAYFPSLAWRYDVLTGGVVVGLKPDSPLRHIGVVEGDIILSVQDRTVKDAHSFQRVFEEEYADLARNGGTMIIRLKRADGPVVAHRLRVPKKTATPSAVTAVKKGGTGTQGKKMPAANIWEDNPFE